MCPLSCTGCHLVSRKLLWSHCPEKRSLAKVKEGVQIYILLYKEVALALKINSVYSKRKLRSVHENLKVLCYPDHFSSDVYLWSHHEKIVIVDDHICFIGGLDLCFGCDHPPLVWPGKDYYNPRESEPNSWEDTMKDELAREKCPRMPWHDVHCALWGPHCRDVATHFVQRWNHAKRNKAPNEQVIPLLMPQQHMVIPHCRRSRDFDVENKNTIAKKKEVKRLESFSPRSSSQDIPLLLPQAADGLDSPDGGLRSNNQHDHNSRINKTFFFPFRKSSKIESVAPHLPMKGIVDDHNSFFFQNVLRCGDITWFEYYR